jgi:hypothetical protein
VAGRDLSETVRVFVGTEPKTEIARRVLECSILRHTDQKVVVTPMIGPAWEYDHAGVPVGTGFSLRRWLIPAFCQWQGRAIYLDADQLVFADINDLWHKPDGHPQPAGCSAWMSYQPDKFRATPWPQSSVMVIDCAAARAQWGWHLAEVLKHLRANPTKTAYADFMHCAWMTPPPGRIEDGWNSLNAHTPGKTKLLHYTKEDTQPWYNPAHPHAHLWQLALSVAIARGFVTDELLEEGLGNWKKKADWRSTNGLHPDYRRFLSKRPSAK